eukprot:3771837-Rhodomonas_salina.1
MAVAMSSRNAMVELNGEFREVKSLPNTLSGAENAIRDAFGFGTGATLLLQVVPNLFSYALPDKHLLMPRLVCCISTDMTDVRVSVMCVDRIVFGVFL